MSYECYVSSEFHMAMCPWMYVSSNPGCNGKSPKMLVSLYLLDRPAHEEIPSTPGAWSHTKSNIATDLYTAWRMQASRNVRELKETSIQEAELTLLPADRATSGLPDLHIFPLQLFAVAYWGTSEPLPLEENLNSEHWEHSHRDRSRTRLYHILSWRATGRFC